MQRFILAALATLGIAVPAQAQRTQAIDIPSSRWVINGHSTAAFGTTIGDAQGHITTSTGLGGGIEVGYRVTPRLLTYAGVDLAKQGIDVEGLTGDFALSHVEAGARLSFPVAHSKAVPYVGLWVGRRSLGANREDPVTGMNSHLSMSGMAIGASGGVQIYMSPKLALDGGLSLGTGRLGTIKVDGQRQDWGTPDRSTSTRLRFGANWYP